MRAVLAALAFSVAAMPALANDSTAQLGAGGLELVRNEVVELLSEDLYVSAAKIEVTYHFRNKTDAPVTYLVAFPLPALDAKTPEEMNIQLPIQDSDDFVGFEVAVNGKPVTASIEQRATALGVDRTAELRRLGLPLNPIALSVNDRIKALPAADREALNREGLILVDEYSAQAAWRLDQTYYWEQTFQPGEEIVISHVYRPVVGYGFFGDWVLKDPGYVTKYCIDKTFAASAKKKLTAIAGSMYPYLTEQRISYILTTANNWAGAIGKFHLTVDKGSADSIVSFCGTGVKKTGPSTFEMTATDFAPEKELEILIAVPDKPTP
jgi:hypothetical protein